MNPINKGGCPRELPETKPVNVRMPLDLYNWLQTRAARNYTDISKVLRGVVESAMQAEIANG